MKLFFVVLLFSISSIAAITTQEIHAPRSTALGSSINANIGSNDVLHDNPSAIAFTKLYTVDAFYTNDVSNAANIYDISIVDSRTSNVAGGFSYTNIKEKNDGPKRDVFYGVLAQRVSGYLSFAVSGRYVKKKLNNDTNSFYDVDVSALATMSRYLSVGFTWKNLRERNENFAPQTMTLGFQGAYSYFFPTFNIIKLVDDGMGNTSRLSYAMGLETVIAKQFFARGGYRIDNIKDKKSYAMGAGWKAPKISFDYAFKRDMNDRNDYGHSIAMRLYF